MNLQSIILLAVILGLAAAVIFVRHRKKNKNTTKCQGCLLADHCNK